ncbi:MAG: phosphate ABC transporter substrate-binding protein PstS [Dysgonamonadaceae bacterium]|jgi:phosphate transport system substrate-binding protein|nr:phosphate ABC transporter substrate-binding protein PstS [Dysgonamonadaceae bacterium]HXL01159.1 phosphate ABC transporter substrate-binding protein PstS [Dysgonamonadaceae bacterium]
MMKKTLWFLLISLAFFSCSGSRDKSKRSVGVTLSGAGATFPYPFYSIVFRDYMRKHPGVTINYGAIGSGGGIRSLRDKSVNFAASDAFLNEKETASMGAEVVHIPTCMGGVVLSYTLSGVDSLRLTGELIADIFMGKITRWNDPRVAAENPNIRFPDLEITPVYRSDGSGTTFVFSEYLNKVSPEWNKEMGAGKALKWKAGLAAKGNPGVASIVQLTEGAIGYVGSEYALTLQMPSAIIKNKAGNYVKATLKTISAAAETDLPDDMKVTLTDMPHPNAYPISMMTWLLVYRDQGYSGHSRQEAEVLVDLLNYIIGPDGQQLAEQVNYVPLPLQAIQKTKRIIDQIHFEGEKISTVSDPGIAVGNVLSETKTMSDHEKPAPHGKIVSE